MQATPSLAADSPGAAAPLAETPADDSLFDQASSAELQAIDTAQIRGEQVELLFSQLLPALAVMLLAAAGLSAMMWSSATAGALVFWWAALGVDAVARVGLYRAYVRRTDRDTTKWLRRFGLSAMSAGAVWGFAGAVFFPTGSNNERVLLAFILAGMVSGGLPMLSAIWQVYVVYAIALLTPITYVLVAFGDRSFVALASFMPLLLVVNLGIAVHLSKTFARGFKMRRAYRKVAGQQVALNRQLDEQLEQLAIAHEEVANSARKLALYIDRAPVAVFEVDEDATVLSANATAEDMLGHPATELEGRSFLRTLFTEEEPLFDAGQWRRFVASGASVAGRKVPCVRRDGLVIMCEFTLTPLVGSGGELLSVIVQAQDITRQLEAERMKQEFTSTLSHELRTPLTSIIGSLQLINTGVMGDIDPDVGELTTVAERNGQRLLDMINDILDIEKIESGRFVLDLEDLSLADLVKESVVLNDGYAKRFKVDLAYPGAGELGPVPVKADRKRLLQVLTNLMSNAAKFSPEGGQVDISLKVEDGRARVWVEDRGSGIPPEFRARMFSRFAQADSALTRKKGGTGLGLAISKRLAEMMDGTIGFEDREGGGTSFYVELPVKAA